MHREPLLKLLETYRLRYPAEGDAALRFEDFVRRNPDCFKRSLREGHVTGSAWIVDKTGTRTLMTHHRKLNIWLQPGGHADGESDVLKVAMAEVQEETGLTSFSPVSREIFDLDIHGIPARKEEPSHFHYDVRFLIQNSADNNYIVSEESHDLAWVEMSDLEEYTDEWSMRRMRDKALAALSGK
ncbi:NUDIX hydrolase [Verrucomicrobiales bacterium BCK34]|nr:NUDIX hydrolase [Verrucomicrobiales bacterium BCK34]